MTQPNPNNPYIKNINNGEQSMQNQGENNSQNNTQNNTQNFLGGLLDANNSKQVFIKGALIGTAATFILTNENAQKAIFKGFAKISSLFESGIEELKERYEDAKAEINDTNKI
ncbi:YtxH domain-containing protein [Helicobacter sp.]|uniref:YtxH domain-containing protein n=1 Tax=Helicobacter sp. TaxID=218 RepID=UPI0025BEC708|nr:YtxH domain-containing protein [Helicobacter sp.]MCI5969362.1 YtxH domain-containing protein [Helicobacter sp.]MDY2585616.1 YtxH domain-containing protein [Helicobacter sp.]